MCSFLFAIFGRDTRGAQLLNFTLAVWWLVVVSLTGLGVTDFAIPYAILSRFEHIAGMFMLAMFTCALAFTTCHRPKQVLKVFAFVLGMLNHAVLANSYLTEYPPLDMMMCVSTVLAIYFCLAALYILKCEGLDGVGLRR